MCGWGEVEDAESGAEPGRTRLFRASTTRALRARTRDRGERGGFCMGIVPASSRDRLTWTGNESRGIAGLLRVNEKIATHAGDFFAIARVCRNTACSPESAQRSLVTQTLTFHSWNLRRKRLGSTIGSASDSSSEGWGFKSLLGHVFFAN